MSPSPYDLQSPGAPAELIEADHPTVLKAESDRARAEWTAFLAGAKDGEFDFTA